MEWQDISDENIKNAEQEHIASTTLRSVINSVLEQTQQDLLKQRQTVNSAFYKRIQEVTNARDTLGEHLNQVQSPLLLHHQVTFPARVNPQHPHSLSCAPIPKGLNRCMCGTD